MLDNLLDIEVAYSLLRGGNEDGDKDPIDINYEKLKTDIKVKDIKGNEWVWIQADVLLVWSLRNHINTKWANVLAWVQWRATEMVKGLEHVLYEEVLKMLGLLTWRRQRGYLWMPDDEGSKDDRLSSVVSSDKRWWAQIEIPEIVLKQKKKL